VRVRIKLDALQAAEVLRREMPYRHSLDRAL
jgi:hypothetical protein